MGQRSECRELAAVIRYAHRGHGPLGKRSIIEAGTVAQTVTATVKPHAGNHQQVGQHGFERVREHQPKRRCAHGLAGLPASKFKRTIATGQARKGKLPARLNKRRQNAPKIWLTPDRPVQGQHASRALRQNDLRQPLANLQVGLSALMRIKRLPPGDQALALEIS